MVIEKDRIYAEPRDVLRLDFQLKEESVVMEAVQVVANSLKNSIATTGAATSVTANDLNKLPVNGRNFTSLIDLSPLSTGSSLSGQLASSTNYTIDGMSARALLREVVQPVATVCHTPFRWRLSVNLKS